MTRIARYLSNRSGTGFSVRLAVLAVFAVLALPVASIAQETTTSVRGALTGMDGQAAAGVTVSVTDTRTGRTKTSVSSDTGRFTISGLGVGGPYTISTDSSQFAEQNITDVFLSLGVDFEFSVALADQSIDEITVTAAAIQSVQVAIGPASTFNFDDLQNLPAINRDLRDVVRVDPRIYIDEGFVGAIQCVGANPRFNSLTVDGIKLNDNFGLNSNGFPTQRQPFPFDAIQNVSLELSPFDVQYGGFTACNINAVTRSGGNEFFGSVFMDYTDDSMSGDSLEGTPVPTGDFDETRWGFSVGGPIIQDKLFFFASYEKADGVDVFDRCAGDEACATPVLGVSRAQLDRIATIARDQYGYEPGEGILNAANEDEKYLIRLDWNINEDHNAALTYNYNDGFNVSEADTFNGSYEFSNHNYERGAELNAYSAQLFSDWNDNFSTDVRFGFAKVDARVETVNDQGFGEAQIETYFDGDGDGTLDRAVVLLGGDDSRQSNKLDYETTNLRFVGNYQLGDHQISGGYEQESTKIFNLFVQHTIGQYNFDENCTDDNGNPVGCSTRAPWTADGCIDQFAAFAPDDIYYGNAGSLNPADAAAQFSSAVNTVYIQDQFTFSNVDFSIVAGLRYDWYTSDDLPLENSLFVARSGFTNRKNFDGESLLQPRLGMNWNLSDTLSVRGGIGLYSGGNPNVWLGNNYQNDGFTAVQVREGDGGVSDLNTNPNRDLTTIPLGVDGNGAPIFDAPQTMIQAVAGGTANVGVNSISPDFKIPSNWKFSLGATWLFDAGFMGDGYTLNADLILSQSENSAIVRDDTNVQVGTAPDGRPIYFQADRGIAGCDTDPLANAAGCSRLFNGDYILDNVQGDDAKSLGLSFTLAKAYDWGFDWTFGYAYTESDEVSPMTSSVAFSNYNNIAVSNAENPGLARSNYEIPNRFILRLGYEVELFGDNATRVNMFASSNQGRPFSYTFDDDEMFAVGPFFNPSSSRNLLYMPSGPSDPNVVFDPGFDQAAFFAYAGEAGLNDYAGGIVERNSDRSDWYTRVDLRISQEIPGFSPEQKGTVFFVIQNLGNLINDDWGVLNEVGFPRTAPIVEASLNDSNQYVFEQFNPQSQSRVASASLWSMRFGVSYNFN